MLVLFPGGDYPPEVKHCPWKVTFKPNRKGESLPVQPPFFRGELLNFWRVSLELSGILGGRGNVEKRKIDDTERVNRWLQYEIKPFQFFISLVV